MNETRSDPRPLREIERAATRFRDDLFASLDGLERTMARLLRRTLIVGLLAIAIAATELLMVVARP